MPMTRPSPPPLLWCLPCVFSAVLGCSPDEDIAPVPTGKPPTNEPPAQEQAGWQDQILYFIMIDRFDDGDPSNNDQGAGEYDPMDPSRYSGGDLRGITDRIEYIRGLGATAIWITPPVANQWWDPWVNYSGYHGYWAENFKEVDKHYGNLDDYKALGQALHDSGMRLIQDIVVNHTGNFFRYTSYDPNDVAAGAELNDGSLPVTAPTQPPFDRNDPTDPSQRSEAIYHFTPVINDFQDPQVRYNYQLSDLDDLNTENPVVVNALKDSYNHWIRDVGVDGFRIDTVSYTPPELYADFIRSESAEHPGVAPFAATAGKPEFFTFGEVWDSVTPYDDAAERNIARYLDKGGAPLIDSALNFPLHFTLQQVFAEGKPTRQLGYRLGAMGEIFKRPHLLLNFIDNHDKPRFSTIGSRAALKQSLLFIYTIPGIPVIYYGTEQDFVEQRGSMFAAGVGSGGVDHFDQGSEMYRFLQQLTELRKEHALLRRGALRVVKDSGIGTGVLAYSMEHEGKKALVVFNTSEKRMLLSNLESNLSKGTELDRVLGLSPGPSRLVAGEGGRLSSVLLPREAFVLVATDTVREVPSGDVAVTIAMPQDAVFSSDPQIAGTLSGAKKLLVVVDDNLTNAVEVTAAEDGTWTGTLPIERLRPDPTIEHTVTAYVPDKGVASESHGFKVNLAFEQLARAADPQGDDSGPTGAYAYPTDASYAGHFGDVRGVTVSAAGKNLQIAVEMNALSSLWNPIYGFDHVSFSIYIDVPWKEGVAVLPNQNAVLPSGAKWDYMILAGGWINALYSAEGATATSHGTSFAPAAEITVDKDASTIHFILPPESLGDLTDLKGLGIYVTTWDYDGGYRPLSPGPGPWTFSGGDGATSPLIMDDTAVVTVDR